MGLAAIEKVRNSTRAYVYLYKFFDLFDANRNMFIPYIANQTCATIHGTLIRGKEKKQKLCMSLLFQVGFESSQRKL